MGVHEADECIQSANTVWELRLKVSLSCRHHLRLSLGARNVLSGGSRTDTSGRTDRQTWRS